MNDYINQNGSLTEAGTDLYDHVEALLRSVVAENTIDAVTLAYIAHQAVDGVNIGMVLDATTEPKKIKLWGEQERAVKFAKNSRYGVFGEVPA